MKQTIFKRILIAILPPFVILTFLGITVSVCLFVFNKLVKFTFPLIAPIRTQILQTRYNYEKEFNRLATNGKEIKAAYEDDKVICFEKYNVSANSSSLSCVNK
jgi:hypothetical protein